MKNNVSEENEETSRSTRRKNEKYQGSERWWQERCKAEKENHNAEMESVKQQTNEGASY